MEDRVSLRPVSENDLALLHRLTSDPDATGQHEWFGFTDPGRFRRQWAENCMLGEDGGMLMVVAGDDRIGFVAWRKRITARTSFCWNVGIALAPGARGKGYGTEAQAQLARYLFAHTQVNRIEATTEINNIAEQRALEKAGFTRRGRAARRRLPGRPLARWGGLRHSPRRHRGRRHRLARVRVTSASDKRGSGRRY